MKSFISDESALNESTGKSNQKTIQVSRKPMKCPVCRSHRIASYLYGMPEYSEKLQKDLDDGKIVLGGCCISFEDPIWVCKDCKTDFYKKDDNSILNVH